MVALLSFKADLIICTEVLQDISDHENLLKVLRNSLKPNGMLVLHVPARKNLCGNAPSDNVYNVDMIKGLLKESSFHEKSSQEMCICVHKGTKAKMQC